MPAKVAVRLQVPDRGGQAPYIGAPECALHGQVSLAYIDDLWGCVAGRLKAVGKVAAVTRWFGERKRERGGGNEE